MYALDLFPPALCNIAVELVTRCDFKQANRRWKGEEEAANDVGDDEEKRCERSDGRFMEDQDEGWE